VLSIKGSPGGKVRLINVLQHVAGDPAESKDESIRQMKSSHFILLVP
jgi:hypothetical protein